MNKQLEFHLKTVLNNIKILKNLYEFIQHNYSLPLNEKNYIQLKKDDFKLLDSIAYRYLKTQSILGEKLFREILEYSEYDISSKSYIEILSELERENIITIEEWKMLRELRNSLSHDYPYDEKEIIDALNFLYYNLTLLEDIITKLKVKYEKISKIKSKRN
jgi:hypothetical protein